MTDTKIETYELTSDDSATYKWSVGDVTFRIHGQLAEDHRYYRLIGLLVSTCSHFEHAIDLVIWDLLGVPHTEAALTTRGIVGASKRLDLLVAVATRKGIDSKIIDEIEMMKPKASQLQQQRNRIIHDPWYIDKDDGTVGQFRSMPKDNPCLGVHDVDEVAVVRLTEEIREQWDLVTKLWSRMFEKA
jgi:hypothetical protein